MSTLAQRDKTDSHLASHQCNGMPVTVGCIDASTRVSTKSPPAGPDVSLFNVSVSARIPKFYMSLCSFSLQKVFAYADNSY